MLRARALQQVVQILVGLLPLVGIFEPRTREAIRALIHATPYDYAILAMLGAFLVYLTAQQLAAQRSRLTGPGQLIELARCGTADALKGRADDAREIVDHCAAYQQVFISGLAGVGKSAIVTLAVMPGLKAKPIHPIYVDRLGDTGSDEAASLASAVMASFSPDEWEQFDQTGDLDPADLKSFLLKLQPVLGKTPLVIFDHFDEYIARNIFLFPRGTGGVESVSPAKMFTDVHPFWQDVAGLVESGRLRTLHVSTLDLLEYNDFFHFSRRHRPYHLALIKRAVVDAAISDLERTLSERGAAIEFPDGGWRELRARLIEDLANREVCLPHQYHAALAGLTKLDCLTLDEYSARGRLTGLCARFLENVANEVSDALASQNAAAVKPEQVALALSILRPSGHGSGAGLTVAQIAERVTEAEKAAGAGIVDSSPSLLEAHWGACLAQLERRQLVRRRVEQAGEARFELRHEYLVAAADHRVEELQPFPAELRRFASAHAAAGTWSEKWNTLLPLSTQLRLARDRLLKRFEYGTYAAYAKRSLVRAAVLPLAVLAYVIIADVGTPLPFSSGVRAALDSLGLTVFRQPAPFAVSIQRLKAGRDRSLVRIKQRCFDSRWCNPDDGGSEVQQPWGTLQAIAGMLSNDEVTPLDFGNIERSLDVVFASQHRFQVNGVFAGWTGGVVTDCPIVESSVWARMALGRARMSLVAPAPMRTKLEEWDASVVDAIDNYRLNRSDRSSPVGEFPRDPLNASLAASVYATSLTLLGQLDDPSQREIARGTARWLAQNIQDAPGKRGLRGWPAQIRDGESISDGVTMQVLYALLRARAAKLFDDPHDLVRHLAVERASALMDRSDVFGEDATQFLGKYSSHACEPPRATSYGHIVRFMWYPWAVGVCLEWQSIFGGTSSHREELTIRRALEHLANLADQNFADVERVATYRLSEFVYVMHSARPSGTETSPASK